MYIYGDDLFVRQGEKLGIFLSSHYALQRGIVHELTLSDHRSKSGFTDSRSEKYTPQPFDYVLHM